MQSSISAFGASELGGLIHLAHSFGTAPLHAGFSSLVEYALRNVAYRNNTGAPNVIPPVDVIIDWIVRTYPLDINKGLALLAAHGITNDPKHVSHFSPEINQLLASSCEIWNSHFDSRKLRPHAPLIFDLEARGFYGNTSQSIEAQQRLGSLLRWTQADLASWKEYREALLYGLDPTQVLDLFRRQFFTLLEYRGYMQALGVASYKDRTGLENLARVIPSPTELAVMARRFAFADQHVIDALGLDSEYPADFAYWAERTGFGKVKGYTNGDPDGKEVDFAKNTWRIHWNTVAPTMGYIWYQRYRANRDHWGEDPQFANLVLPFSDPDPGKITLSLLLRDAGYTEPMRPFLAAASYRLLGFRQLGQIQYFNLAPQKGDDKGRDWLKNRLQDNGYQEQAADLFAQSLIKANARKRAQQQLGLTRSLIEDAWRTGVINSVQAVSFLVQTDYSVDEANAAVVAWDLDLANRQAKQVVNGIRRNYLLGDLTDNQVATQLSTAGITNERISQYITRWGIEQRQYRLERTPSVLTRWLLAGLITVEQFEERLARIGWAQEDIERIIAEAMLKAGKGGKPPKQKQLSDTQIKELLKQELITRQVALQHLAALGYDPVDADLLLRLWGY